MNNDYLNGYLNGLLEGAATVYGKLGYHMVNAVCFGRNSFQEEFAQMVGAEPEDFMIEESWERPEDMFRAIFYADEEDPEQRNEAADLADKLLYLLSFELGNPEYVMRFQEEAEVRENASGYMGGWGPFYYMEGLFFIVFENATVLFMLGNDE